MDSSTGKMFGGAPKMIYVDNAKYYEILGVSKNASQDALKKAYREAAMKYHPDKGGDPEKFKELAQAYGVLGDPEKRQIYNLHRQEIVRTLKVSLTDLYNGTSKKENFSRIAICSNCNGKGSKSGASIMECSGCQGSGMVPYIRHFIPGMKHPCYQCKGTGETLSETINDDDLCEQCEGKKIVREKVVLQVYVRKGMQNGQNITFTREVVPTKRGGGVVFILQQEEHPKFKRKGDDLYVEHTLSPREALFGFQFGLTHLDNRRLIIKSQPGEVVKPGQVNEINGEGMPMYERPCMRGNLYIHFTVECPDALTLTPGEAAMKHHPDKGGDPEKFKELAQAHEVLSDPKKLEIYNRIYNRHRRDIVRVIKVSLTDLYNGTFKKENFSRNSICSKCKGKGSKSGPSLMQCSGCRGSGMKLSMRHLPQPIPLLCFRCQGTGETLSETISDEDRCEQCKGEQVVREKEVLEVPVEKGMQNGQEIKFPREVFPTTGGGIVFILQQEEHPEFKRKGDDLFVEHTLSLTEALFGFQFTLTHLDNRQLKIKYQPGEFVKPGQVKEINGEGMPMYERPSMRGKLYIRFTVEFPDGPTPDQCMAIEAVLAPRRSTQLTDMEVDEGEETTLHDGNQQQAQEAYDDMHCEMMKMKDMRGEGAMRKRVGRPLWMMRTCNKAKRGNDDMHK